MKKIIYPQDQTFWYLQRPSLPCLRESIETEIVIIGGGMAGLTAAQAFAKKNKKVVLLEAYYCGAGASGKSSGFITPNSELSLSNFISRYGDAGGKAIWTCIESGAEHIRTTINQYQIDCDYEKEDSLFVANSAKKAQGLLQEYENLLRLGYQTSFFSKERLSSVLGSNHYYGGVTYGNTFGINAYKYCQALKAILNKQGVTIYEETPALSIGPHSVTTLHGTVKADYIIVCTDRFTPELGRFKNEIYHAQNFLLISQVLTTAEKQSLFPGQNFMVWDTDLLYTYFRLSDNRLLLGGGSLLHMYDRTEKHGNQYVFHKLMRYFKKKFPQLELQFEQLWPGMIGISKDIAPLAGRDKTHPSIYYIAATAGLPVAAALAHYCADHLIDGRNDLKDYFSPYRKFLISGFLQKMVGMKLSFALSNFFALKIE